jgi:DNA-binding XRE family transcriptional regulator
MHPSEIPNDASTTTEDRYTLRTEVLDPLMAAKGAKSKAEHARRFGINRTDYWHIRKGRKTPSVEVALAMAREADTTVEVLFGRAA